MDKKKVEETTEKGVSYHTDRKENPKDAEEQGEDNHTIKHRSMLL